MKIENTKVCGIDVAFRAMRNPMDSWDKSDSDYAKEDFTPGPKDIELACKLVAAGSDHRKFLRLIMAYADFTLPRYVWTEFDTYKVGVTRLSCSTMHKLGNRHLLADDFEGGEIPAVLLQKINRAISRYQKSPTTESFLAIKHVLPESFLQKATICASYEALFNMYFQRANHRLPQWSDAGGICHWIHSLPLMSKFIEC